MKELKTVLLIDDDDAHLLLMKRALKYHKLEVFEAGCVADGIKKIEATRPDLIIADNRLPDGTSMDILQKFASHYPVVVTTSFGNEKLAIELIKAGAMDYWMKSDDTFIDLPRFINRVWREWTHLQQRKTAEAELIAREKQYRALIENMNDVFFTYDTNFIITYISPGVRQMGYQPEEIINTPLLDYIYEEDKKQVQDSLYRLIDNKTKDSLSFRIMAKDGSIKYVDENGAIIFNESGEIDYFTGVLHNITELKSKEKALQQSEARYRNLIENAVDIIFLLDAEGNFLHVNDAFLKEGNWEESILKAMNYSQLIHPDDLTAAQQAFSDCLHGKSAIFEIRIRRSDNTYGWYSITTKALFEDNTISAIHGIARNVTDRRLITEALRRSEQKYRIIAENISDVIWITDNQLKITFISPSVQKMFGYTPQECLSLSLEKFLTNESYYVVLHQLQIKKQQYISGEQTEFEEIQELDALHKEGHRISIEVKWRTNFDGKNDFTGVQAVARDITERKKAERGIRLSEFLFRSVWEQSSDGMRITDGNGLMVKVNQAFCRLVDMTRDQLEGNTLSVVYEKAMQERVLEQYLKHFQRYNFDNYFEREVTLWNGKKIWFAVTSSFMGANPPSVLCIFRDITAQKKVAIELHQTNRELKDAQRIAHLANYYWNKNTGELRWSDELWNITGLPESQQPSLEKFIELIHPEDREASVVRATNAFDNTQDFSSEYRIIRPDGQMRYVYDNAQAIRENDSLIQFGILQDITERKQIEIALQQSEERFKAIVENQGEGIGIVNLDEVFVYANRAAEQIFEVETNGLSGRNLKEFLSVQIQNVVANETLQRKTGASSSYELSIVTAKKNTKYLLVTATPHYDKNGTIIGSYGVFRDITERKKTEEQNTIMALMLDNAPSTITVHDYDGRFLYANQRTFEIHGYTKEEFLSLPLYKLDLPETAELIASRMQEIMTHGEANFEVAHYHKNGSIIPIEIIAKKVVWGNTPAILSIGTVIAERKAAESKIRESEEKYRALVENHADCIMRFDHNCRHLFVNKVVYQFTGMHADAFIGKTHYQMGFPEELCKFWTHCINTVFETGKPYFTEFVFQKNEEDIFVDWRLFPELGDSGETNTVLTIARNISDQVLAGKQLHESEQKYRTLVESISDIIFTLDNSGYVTFISPKIKGKSGYLPEEVIGKHFLYFIHEEDAEQLRKRFTELGNGVVKESEYRFMLKNGDYMWVRSISEPVYDDKGNIISFRGILSDIHARKMAEQSLAISEKRFKSLFAVMKSGVIILQADEGGNNYYIIDFNKAAAENFLKKRINLIGKNFKDMFPEATAVNLFFAVQKAYLLGEESFINAVYIENALKKGWFEYRVFQLPSQEVVVAFDNVSERIVSELVIKESEERYKLLFENSGMIVLLIDPNDGSIIDCNTTALNFYKFSKQQLITSTIFDLSTSSVEQIKIKFKIALSGRQEVFKAMHITNNSEIKPVEIAVSIVNIKGAKQLLFFIQDISERIEIEKRIFNATIQAEENERRRLARELHDGLGAILSSIKIYLGLLEKNANDANKVVSLTGNVADFILQAIQSVREMANNLQPSALTDFGLMAAIQDFIEKINNTKVIKITFVAKGIQKRIHDNAELILYRIMEELINNTLKHAKASNANLEIIKNTNFVSLKYTDDGAGMDMNAVLQNKKGGNGIKNIISRVQSIEGTVDIFSEPGKGFEINLEFNLVKFQKV